MWVWGFATMGNSFLTLVLGLDTVLRCQGVGQLPKITQKITYKFIFYEFDENVGMGVCDYGQFISHISFVIGHRFEVPEGGPTPENNPKNNLQIYFL